jgi:hypothetical protein
MEGLKIRHVARMGEIMNECKFLVGKLEEKRSLGKPRRRWMGNVENGSL